MSVLTEESKEALSVSIKSATKEIFEAKINDKIDEKYNKKEKMKEEEGDESDKDEELEEEEDGDDDDSDDSDEDEELEESMKVVAVRSGNTKKKDEFQINRLGDLKQHAKKYDWIMVTKKNGEEIEYSVENGKLVEM